MAQDGLAHVKMLGIKYTSKKYVAFQKDELGLKSSYLRIVSDDAKCVVASSTVSQHQFRSTEMDVIPYSLQYLVNYDIFNIL